MSEKIGAIGPSVRWGSLNPADLIDQLPDGDDDPYGEVLWSWMNAVVGTSQPSELETSSTVFRYWFSSIAS